MATKLNPPTASRAPSISSAQRAAASRLSAGTSAPEKWRPHKYQLKAVKFLLERNSAGLFLDPGLGKTSVTYAAIKVLKTQGLGHVTLVVAPRRPAVMVWPQEHAKWAEFSGLSVGLVHGPRRERVWAEKHDVYVVTYEGFLWLIKTGLLKTALRAKKVHNVAFDELSKMKNTPTARYKTIKPWLKMFMRRWGLTGSPAANGLMDLFGECFTLDLGRALGQFITHYRFQYFDAYEDKSMGDSDDLKAKYARVSYSPKPGAEDAIYARLANLALRIDAKDHLELPKLIPNKIFVDLDPETRAKYDEFEEEFLVELEGQPFTADTAASLSIKCRQMAQGALYEDRVDPLTGIPRAGKRKYAILHNEKIDALEELIDGLNGQQVFVMYEYGHDRERLLDRLGAVPCIGGGTSDKKALEYEEAWNAGAVQVLLGHPASVGHGLNLQKSSANQIAIFSMTWNYEYYDQFIRRLLRQGNKASRVFVHHILARNTVDELVYSALNRKGSLQQRLHDALRDYQSRK